MASKQQLEAEARLAAAHWSLDAALVCAVVEQESGWDPEAVRLEQGFLRRYVRQDLPPQERVSRAVSWGLMQVMGQTAREHGFDGEHLSDLCVPGIGLEIGCRVLAAYLKQKGGNVRDALLRWNGGGNPRYPDEVLTRVAKYSGTAVQPGKDGPNV